MAYKVKFGLTNFLKILCELSNGMGFEFRIAIGTYGQKCLKKLF